MSDRLLARLRGSVPSYRLLFDAEGNDLGLKTPAGIDHAQEYNPQETVESDHDLYYVVLDSEQREKMIEPYLDAVNAGLSPIAQEEYNSVDVIFRTTGRRLMFARVASSARIHENGKQLLVFGESDVSVSTVSFAIDVKGEVDAYYDGNDRIYFAKYARAKPLFKNFDEFFQQAWYEDKENFLGSDLFAVSEIEPEDISVADTKLIAEIRANLNLDLDDPATRKKILDYAGRYPLSGVIVNSDGRIKITTKEDVKCTVRLLTQRYFTSEITGEVLEARGAAKMKDQKPANRPKPAFSGQSDYGSEDM